MRIDYPWPYVSTEHYYHQPFQAALSSASGKFLIHIQWLVLWEILKEILFISLKFSLCAVFSPPVLCPANSNHLGLPCLSGLSSLPLRLRCVLIVSCPGSNPKDVNWTDPSCFGLSDHCLLLPDIQHLENHHFTCFIQFLVALGRRRKSYLLVHLIWKPKMLLFKGDFITLFN